MSFFYEAAASVVERRAVDDVGFVISRAEAAPGWSRSTLGLQPSLSGGHALGPAYGCPMAGFAGARPRWVHLLAAAADVGRTRRLAKGVAQTAGPVRRTQAAGVGRSLSGRHFRHRPKKGALPSAQHVAGKVRSAWWWSTAVAYLSERHSRPRRFPNTGLQKARSER